MTQSILFLLEEIRAIAQLGLNYTSDHYDRERYEKLLHLASTQYAQLTDMGSEEIFTRFRKELGHITPKIGVSAAIFNQEGHLLLVKRTDDYTWGLPCGWTEVNESPQESLIREVREETGLEVTVGEIIRLGCRKPGHPGYNSPHTSYHLQFHCCVVGGGIRGSYETTDVGYYDSTTITNWHPDHEIEAKMARDFWLELNQSGSSRKIP